jgi:Leucine-rich repeat (LRR) protein
LAKIESRIFRLLNLTELDLASNELETVPEDISRLASLQQLNLADNWLTNLPRAIIGSCVSYPAFFR